ncbi:hypothetical protein SprV_0602223500 [Sparganum proliferum]
MRVPSSILLQAALISMFAISARTHKICRNDHTDCETLTYTTGNTTKDAECRDACAKQRGGLTQKETAYYCEGDGQSCSQYAIHGRQGYNKIFERHVMCVLSCLMVGQAESRSASSIKVCNDQQQQTCIPIESKDGTFNAFRMCVPDCSGWTDLEKREEHTAYTCTDTRGSGIPKYEEVFGGMSVRMKTRKNAWLKMDGIATRS